MASLDKPFQVVHPPCAGAIEARWRACLAASDFPTHYTAPEFFLEPAFRDSKPFAVLSIADDKVTGVLTGISHGAHVRSGLSVRPQIAFLRDGDHAQAMTNLVSGLLVAARSAKLVDLFMWSDIEALVANRFRRRRYDGVVMLDLSQGPAALLRSFSENKRTNIKKAIKYGVSVAPATSPDEISKYYAIYVDWSNRKGQPIVSEEQFQETFALTGNRLLLLARHETKMIAGIVIWFFPHGVMEYAANSSLESALRLRPNDLLHWRAIESGMPGGHDTLQPWRDTPFFAQIREEYCADHALSPRPLDVSPFRDRGLVRRTGGSGPLVGTWPDSHDRSHDLQ